MWVLPGPLLAAFLLLGGCRSTSLALGPRLEVTGPHTALARADRPSVHTAVLQAADARGFEVRESSLRTGRVVLRSQPFTRFFGLIGEQVRFEQATVQVSGSGDRYLVRVEAALHHGPRGGPFKESALEDARWYETFFDALEQALESALPESIE